MNTEFKDKNDADTYILNATAHDFCHDFSTTGCGRKRLIDIGQRIDNVAQYIKEIKAEGPSELISSSRPSVQKGVIKKKQQQEEQEEKKKKLKRIAKNISGGGLGILEKEDPDILLLIDEIIYDNMNFDIKELFLSKSKKLYEKSKQPSLTPYPPKFETIQSFEEMIRNLEKCSNDFNMATEDFDFEECVRNVLSKTIKPLTRLRQVNFFGLYKLLMDFYNDNLIYLYGELTQDFASQAPLPEPVSLSMSDSSSPSQNVSMDGGGNGSSLSNTDLQKKLIVLLKSYHSFKNISELEIKKIINPIINNFFSTSSKQILKPQLSKEELREKREAYFKKKQGQSGGLSQRNKEKIKQITIHYLSFQMIQYGFHKLIYKTSTNIDELTSDDLVKTASDELSFEFKRTSIKPNKSPEAKRYIAYLESQFLAFSCLNYLGDFTINPFNLLNSDILQRLMMLSFTLEMFDVPREKFDNTLLRLFDSPSFPTKIESTTDITPLPVFVSSPTSSSSSSSYTPSTPSVTSTPSRGGFKASKSTSLDLLKSKFQAIQTQYSELNALSDGKLNAQSIKGKTWANSVTKPLDIYIKNIRNFVNTSTGIGSDSNGKMTPDNYQSLQYITNILRKVADFIYSGDNILDSSIIKRKGTELISEWIGHNAGWVVESTGYSLKPAKSLFIFDTTIPLFDNPQFNPGGRRNKAIKAVEILVNKLVECFSLLNECLSNNISKLQLIINQIESSQLKKEEKERREREKAEIQAQKSALGNALSLDATEIVNRVTQLITRGILLDLNFINENGFLPNIRGNAGNVSFFNKDNVTVLYLELYLMTKYAFNVKEQGQIFKGLTSHLNLSPLGQLDIGLLNGITEIYKSNPAVISGQVNSSDPGYKKIDQSIKFLNRETTLKDKESKFIVNNAASLSYWLADATINTLCPITSIMDGMSQCSFNSALGTMEIGNMNVNLNGNGGKLFYEAITTVNMANNTDPKGFVEIVLNIGLNGQNYYVPKFNVMLRTGAELQAKVVYTSILTSLKTVWSTWINEKMTTNSSLVIDDIWNILAVSRPTQVGSSFSQIFKLGLRKSFGDIGQEINSVIKNGGYTNVITYTSSKIDAWSKNGNAIRLSANGDRPSGFRAGKLILDALAQRLETKGTNLQKPLFTKGNAINQGVIAGYIDESIFVVLGPKATKTISSRKGGMKKKTKKLKKYKQKSKKRTMKIIYE